MTLQAVSKGTILFRPEQECAGFVIVHEGTIKVSLTGENGREIVLYRVRPGDVCLQTFGCLVQDTPYSAEGVAETDLVIEIVLSSEFHQKIAQDENFRSHIFRAVAARFFDLERLVEDVALSTVAERLARALLRLANEQGHVCPTHDALATEIGSGRAVVSRQLAEFQRIGLVEAARGDISIRNRDALRATAHLDG